MTTPTIRQRLSWRATPEQFEEIRNLWIHHSKAEDARDLDGLIFTLTPDCVYEVVGTAARWEGHTGARQFYTDFLGAFPDVKFDLQEIVIGPQGVFEEAIMTGTRQGTWLGAPGDGALVRTRVMILFPWDPARKKFLGEKVYADFKSL